MYRKYFSLLLVGIVLLIVTVTAGAQDASRTTALAFIAENHKVAAEDLTIEYEFQTSYAGFGRVTHFKVLSQATGNSYGVVVSRSGQAWTPEEFRRTLDEAYRNSFGKLEQQLKTRLEENPGAVIPVAIWIATDDALYSGLRGVDYVGHGVTIDGTAPPRIDNPESFDESSSASSRDVDAKSLETDLRAAQQALAAQVAQVQAQVAGRLAAQGINTEAVADTPLLTAALTHAQVLAASQDPAVLWIEADDVENVDLNNSATATHRAPAVWSRRYTGQGARVAILEDSRAFNNFWLNIPDARVRVPGDANVDNHATQSMGNVGSSHPVFLGMAREATLYSANATTYNASDLRAAGNWAASQGVHVVNNSWGPNVPTGCLSSLGRFFDYRAFVNAQLITFAAGNSGNFVNDHAMGYNMLAVGAVDDQDTDAWLGDTMAGYSSRHEGANCSNGDKEKPDVSAVGSRIFSTNMGSSPAVGGAATQGTSFAAPMVAGEAALLISRNPNLAFKPEALRAIIMASAVHNIEGASRLSEVDGAGAIDAYSAYLTVNNGWWLQQTVNPQTWTGTPLSFYANAGEKIRCAAAWTSHPNATQTTDPLLTDIDLRLYRPSGTAAASSIKINSSYEILEYTANESGTWTCRAYRYSTTPGTTFEYLGMAAYRGFQQNVGYPQ